MIHIQYGLCTRYALASSVIIHPCPEERGEGSDGFTRRTSQVGRSVVRDDDVDADERERRRDDDGDEHRCRRRGRRRVDARENAVVGTSRDRGRCRF